MAREKFRKVKLLKLLEMLQQNTDEQHPMTTGAILQQLTLLEIPCDRTLGDIIRKTLRQGDEIVLPSAVRVDECRDFWTDDLNGKVMYHRSDDIAPDAPHRWTLRHTQSPCTVSEAVDFIPSRMDIWAVEHCACTEFYFSAGLQPGESARWQRVWTFGP